MNVRTAKPVVRAAWPKIWLMALSLFTAIALNAPCAKAETSNHPAATLHVTSSKHFTPERRLSANHKSTARWAHNARERRNLRYASAKYRHSILQCVPYAREVSHINLSGNAFLWWAEAAGRYARGSTPVEGAVLNFRAVGRMPLGHVAVVTSVIDNRTVLVTQANWVRGTITNDVTVQDVSPNNDWTQVQVELGDSDTWGAAYPAYGFIYNQPASSTIIASGGAQGNEVAEAPRAAPVLNEAPDRNLQ
jgi:surface antigen